MIEQLTYDGFPFRQREVGSEIRHQFDKSLAFDLQAGREGGFVYVADAAQIIFGDPFPEFQLRMLDYRSVVEQQRYLLQLIAFGPDGSDRRDYACIKFFKPERHDNATPYAQRVGHAFRYLIGIGGIKGQRQYDFGEFHQRQRYKKGIGIRRPHIGLQAEKYGNRDSGLSKNPLKFIFDPSIFSRLDNYVVYL